MFAWQGSVGILPAPRWASIHPNGGNYPSASPIAQAGSHAAITRQLNRQNACSTLWQGSVGILPAPRWASIHPNGGNYPSASPIAQAGSHAAITRQLNRQNACSTLWQGSVGILPAPRGVRTHAADVATKHVALAEANSSAAGTRQLNRLRRLFYLCSASSDLGPIH